MKYSKEELEEAATFGVWSYADTMARAWAEAEARLRTGEWP